MAERSSTFDGPMVEGACAVEAAAGRVRDRCVTVANDRFERSQGYVSENPTKSVLVAMGVGALTGYLLGHSTS